MKCFALTFILFITFLNASAQVGIGTPTPATSAQLDVSSNTRGFLLPRMTRAQRGSINSPVPGLMIWCSNCGTSGELQVFNGTEWTNLTGGAASAALPTITTAAVTSIAATTATSGGNVTDDGGSSLTARGVVWSTSQNPSTSDSKTTDAGTTGTFTSSITGLTASTTYYVRAYATNSAGTSYGTQVSFTTSAPPFVCGATVTFNYNGSSVTYGTVTGANGKCWLDRNLGATKVAGSRTDNGGFGDLFQWGRLADGHQLVAWSGTSFTALNGTRTMSTLAQLPTSDNPGYPDYIDISSLSLNGVDWRNPKNDLLWQGVSGINNPCPSGWRLPTMQEWADEGASWTNYNSGFNSVLKLPSAGGRSYRGAASQNGSESYYWSSDISNNQAKYMYLGFSSVSTSSTKYRAEALPIRCIQD